MKYSLGISNFLEETSSLSYSIVFLYFFALIAEEGFSQRRDLENYTSHLKMSVYPNYLLIYIKSTKYPLIFTDIICY